MAKREKPEPAGMVSREAPPGVDVRLRRGWGLYASGDNQGACAEARRSAEAAPGDPEAPYLLGMALKAAGDSAGAVAAFRQAATLAAGEAHDARTTMLRRLAVGQANWLETGDWNLEPETWVRA